MNAFTPMLLQYLVGLCCMRVDPDAVDVMLGDLVPDHAAGKARDVDVTVTLRETDGSIHAFKAYEVKKEGRALDVATVEQLSAKLSDMKDITHRSIVSASGFTPAAIAKAEAHGIELFEFRPWRAAAGQTMPSFSGGAFPPQIGAWHRALLCWRDWKIWLLASRAPETFTWALTDALLDSNGHQHHKFGTMGAFADHLLGESTEILLRALDRAPALPPLTSTSLGAGEVQRQPLEGCYTHTIDVTRYGAYLQLDLGPARVESVSITGALEWETSLASPQFYVIEEVPSGLPFAGAAITEYGTPDGRMCALTFAPNSPVIGVHPSIALRDKHKHAIRQLALVSSERGSSIRVPRPN